MEFKNRENKKITHKNKDYWISRSVAVNSVLLFKKDKEIKVLITKRGEICPNFRGYWCVPSGYLDWDESGHEGAIREIYEETELNIFNLNIIYNHIIDSQPFFINTMPTESNQNVSLYYGAVIEVDEWPILDFQNEEVAKIELIDINKLYKKFAFNHDKRIKDFHKLYLSNFS